MRSGQIARVDVIDVRITRKARADLLAIDDYGLANFGLVAAESMGDGFRAAFKLLGEYPEIAPLRPDYGDGLRCKVHQGYRIVYEFDDDAVYIVRVLHHSRDVRSAMTR